MESKTQTKQVVDVSQQTGPVRSTFLDPTLDAALDKDGYVVVPLLDAAAVKRLTEAYDTLGVAPGDPQRACIDTFHCFDPIYKEAVHAEVEEVLAPAVQSLFDRHKSLSYCYIQKWPGETSGFGLHQDISVVDETKFRSVEVWCALTDTDEVNGQLWVVPGSHNWAPVARGIHGCPPPYSGVEQRIVRQHAIPVPMKAGEAIIFRHSTYHFSFANRSSTFRLVAATDLIPEEAQHLHYVANGQGRIDEFEIDETFWTVNNPFTLLSAPDSARRLGEVDPEEFPRLTHADLDRLVAEGRAIQHEPLDLGDINPSLRWCHRCGTDEGVDGYVDSLVGNITLLCPRCEAAQARMAGVIGDIDATVLAALEQDGYAVVPFLDADERAAAKELIASLDIPSDTGFYASNQSAERADAVRIDRAFQVLAQPAVDRVLPGYRVFKGVAVVKGATGDNPVALHQDWEYVDERYHRGYVIWCPLDGATAHQGGMQVIPGSHRWLDNHRGSDFDDPFAEVRDEIIARASLDVPVVAGQAVIYDNALLHHTPPNRSGRVRQALAVAVAPPQAPVIHMKATAGGQAEVFEIPPGSDHFTAHEFGARPEGAPTRVVDAAVPTVTTEQLEALLGANPPASRPVSPTPTDTSTTAGVQRVVHLARKAWRRARSV